MLSVSRLFSFFLVGVFVVLSACDSTVNEPPTAAAAEDPSLPETTPATPPPDAPAASPVFTKGAYPMEIQSAGGGPLYRHTRNDLTVTVPLISTDSLVLTDGNTTVSGPNIILVPDGDSVSLSARALMPDGSQMRLRTRTRPVFDPPPPFIEVLSSSGRNLVSGDAVSKARPVLDFIVTPNREYARAYPSDARYRIQRARVSVRTGTATAVTMGTFNLSGGSSLKLVRQLRSATPGDQLLIELEGIIRINTNGAAIPIALPESMRSFAFVLS